MAVNVTEWSIAGAQGQVILGNSHLPAGGEPGVGVLVICHGFKGYKDYGFIPQLADAAARRGLIAHRFNFSHSGMTNRTETFERPDLFEQDTWSKQIYDLQAVVGAIDRGELEGKGKAMTWFGHSRGGVAVLLTAGRVFADEDIKVTQPAGVISASAPDDACSFGKQHRAMLHKHGRLESPSARTGQVLYVGRAWLEEIEAGPNAFDPVLSVAKIGCPIQLIHGQGDATVPVDAAKHIAQAAGATAQLAIIPGASHTFNAPNPLPLDQEPPPQTLQLIDISCDFALRQCASE